MASSPSNHALALFERRKKEGGGVLFLENPLEKLFKGSLKLKRFKAKSRNMELLGKKNLCNSVFMFYKSRTLKHYSL